ncbi:TraR/DksA C4-type zinc finger protein [Cellulomonas cellasea]|uniref:RNA polymerase-binding transcription factor DksA n=1 Tax=Cellulomonas cellasea TaxID=43670 RepID=A0A7W4UE83_9CELL|nr:TraR/DksA C4-type zinc finger protein [Cellulomonas cellasea]MBB2922055.1 RNA polymerase-binding transcription factor DksA [Cellulomonas cellasea]
MTDDAARTAGRGAAADAPAPAEPFDARAVLTDLRAGLVGRLRELTGAFDELVAASADSNADDEHDPEGATIAFERSQLDTIVRHVRHQLAETDAALGRVDAGTYGVCEVCGRPVPGARLEARPVARTCVGCAS